MTAFFALLSCLFGIIAVLISTFYYQERCARIEAQQESKSIAAKAERDFKAIQEKAKAALARYKSIADLEAYKSEMERSIDVLTRSAQEREHAIATQEQHLQDLTGEIAAVEDNLSMQSFGFYQPKYDLQNSSAYLQRLGQIRDDQKALVKSELATQCPVDWMVEGSASKGRTMVKEHAKLMLRAFNGECDAAIGQVKYNSVNNMETRIKRSFEAINKLGASKKIWITPEYYNLKLHELFLVHEHREKVQQEREEQRRIKEQMREEEKVRREIENAQRDAEREEVSKSKALEKARHELAEADSKQMNRLQAIVDRLEAELKDALERKAKAIARAQLTKSGHIYVLSNIGSFGEGIYKIGMTRRLEPLERVDELGDASVPFDFDVHAMIYSEDAPNLEYTLHQRFKSRRVNMVNTRREFFRVSLDEIRVAVEEHFGTVTFVTVPEAEEYRKTESMLREMKDNRSSAATLTSSASA